VSTDLIIALLGILAGFVAFAPAMIGEKGVKDFGDRFNGAAWRIQRALRGGEKVSRGGLPLSLWPSPWP